MRGLRNQFNTTASEWRLRRSSLHFGRRPALMGIVNVTPDSFSDGGQSFDTNAAVTRAMELIAAGADIIDIGGESTRPYGAPTDEPEELRRVVPVIRELRSLTAVAISVDTSKSVVAEQAIDAGADIVNDVTGLEGDPNMLAVTREAGVGLCVMHMSGTPANMQDNPNYDDAVTDIYEYLDQRKERLVNAGIDESKICVDPGIGFGKTVQHNLELLHGCDRYHSLGCPVLIGHSRKGFIGSTMHDREADRDSGTLAISLMLAQKAIQVIRVHEVANTRQALTLFDACGAIDGTLTGPA